MKTINLFIHVAVLFLTISCATKKPNCEAYSTDNYVVTEINIHIPEHHHHFEKVTRCYWHPAVSYVYLDTMWQPELGYNEIERIKMFRSGQALVD